MREKLSIISEQTVVPLGVLLVIIGGITWLNHIAFEADASAKAIVEMSQKQDEYNRMIQSIDKRLSHIEGVLEEREDHETHR